MECIDELQSDDCQLVISHLTSDGDTAAASGAINLGHGNSTLEICDYVGAHKQVQKNPPKCSVVIGVAWFSGAALWSYAYLFLRKSMRSKGNVYSVYGHQMNASRTIDRKPVPGGDTLRSLKYIYF